MSDILIKRFTLLKKLEYFIEESVYYRTHSDSMTESAKGVILKNNEETGKIKVL